MSIEDDLFEQRLQRIREIEALGFPAYGRRFEYSATIPEILAEYGTKTAEELSPEKRDQILKAIDDGTAQGLPQGRAFFNRARRLTLEGMFGDPYYGGNKGFAGWDLIRYPGPRSAVEADMQRMDKAPAPFRRSAWGPQYQ